jgi:hypothetical protein
MSNTVEENHKEGGINNTEILLFATSIDVNVIDEFNMVIAILQENGLKEFTPKIIDIEENPDLVKEYKVEVSPTLVVRGKKFPGHQKTKDEIIKLGLEIAKLSSK